jgi:hypothetical protein
MSPEESVEREFLQAAVKRSQLLQAGDPKKANKEYDELYRLKGQLRQFHDRGEAALKRISTTEDPDVQIVAAAALLALDEPFATVLLERIRDTTPGIPSLTAEMTLKEWKNGSIRNYWS